MIQLAGVESGAAEGHISVTRTSGHAPPPPVAAVESRGRNAKTTAELVQTAAWSAGAGLGGWFLCSAAVTSDHHQPRPADVIMQSMQVLTLLHQSSGLHLEREQQMNTVLQLYFKCKQV